MTAHVGVENSGLWASSAAWFDYDNDGRLDLVIANYVDWSPERNFYCGDRAPGMRSYCHPDDYHGQPPTLYHNNGATVPSPTQANPRGWERKAATAWAWCPTSDYHNGTGLAGHFHRQPNVTRRFFFFTTIVGHGTFREVAYSAGVAVSDDGQFEAGTGTDAADNTVSG